MEFFPATEEELTWRMFDHEMHLERISRGKVISFTHFRKWGLCHYKHLKALRARGDERYTEFYKEAFEA